MYYPALSNLSEYDNQIITLYDEWLAHKSEPVISIEQLANDINIDFLIAQKILEASSELGVLKKVYAIKCPECNHIIKIVEINELYEAITDIECCDACETDEIIITDENVQILYKKKEKLISKVSEKVSKQYSSISTKHNAMDSLKTYIENGLINTNDIFFNPTVEERETLKTLFEKIGTRANNTTEQGNQLRLFMQELLRKVKLFECANLRTKTNEIDCEVKNRLFIPYPSFLNDISSSFTVECKNEDKKPDNTYFLKLKGIVSLAKQNCGIMVSICEVTKTFKDLQNKTFLKEDIFIISMTYKELKAVVYENVNFLDLFENKILAVRLDTTTDLFREDIFKKKD